MCFIVITKLIDLLLLGFRCFSFPPQHKIPVKFVYSYSFSMWVGLCSTFLYLPTPPTQANSKTQFIPNSSVAVLQSVWMVYSFNTANYLLEAEITRTPPSGGEEAA